MARAKLMATAALKRRLRNLVPDIEKDTDAAKDTVMRQVASKIAQRAPYDSGEYYDSLEAGRVVDNPQARKRPGYRPSHDKNAVGIFGKFYWRFLEFGTAPHVNGGIFAGTEHPGTSAQPHVYPTWDAMKKTVRRDVRKGMNKAIKKSNAGRRNG